MDFVALCCWILGPVTVRDGRSGPMSFPQEFSAETSFLWGLRGGGGDVPPGHRIGKIKYILLFISILTITYIIFYGLSVRGCRRVRKLRNDCADGR